jgi:hypothetical protein
VSNFLRFCAHFYLERLRKTMEIISEDRLYVSEIESEVSVLIL